MDENTRIKAWRNSKKNSYEFLLKYYMRHNSKDDWHEMHNIINKMTKKEFLEYLYSERTHNQAERWKEKFEQISSRYSHGGKL